MVGHRSSHCPKATNLLQILFSLNVVLDVWGASCKAVDDNSPNVIVPSGSTPQGSPSASSGVMPALQEPQETQATDGHREDTQPTDGHHEDDDNALQRMEAAASGKKQQDRPGVPRKRPAAAASAGDDAYTAAYRRKYNECIASGFSEAAAKLSAQRAGQRQRKRQ